MLLQDLTKKLEEIKKQQEKLKQQEKELSTQAVQERVLEVCVEDLINELCNLGYKKVRVDYSPIYAPSSCANKIELANFGFKIVIPKYL